MRGTAAAPGRAEGHATVLGGPGDSRPIPSGSILVSRLIHPHLAPLLFRLSGLVLEEGALLQHATTLARERGIPAVVGVTGATDFIRDGDYVLVDGGSGDVLVEPALSPPTHEGHTP